MHRFYKFVLFSLMLLLGTSNAQEATLCSKKGDGLPPDTQFIANSDGSLTVRPPENWFLLTFQKNKWVRAVAASVTCTCNVEKGGCSPGAKGDSVACVMTTCSNCSKSTDSNFFPVRKDHDGIAFATKSEIGTLPAVNKELLMIPEVKLEIDKFKNKLNIIEGQKATKLAFVRIFGRIGAIEVPASARLPNNASPFGAGADILVASSVVTISAASSVKCTCNTKGTCVHDSLFGVHWCDATNCQSCTMSGI